MLKTITCICCPKGCQVTLDTENPEETVKGFSCQQGHDYALSELIHPMRTISSTAAITGGLHPRIPVKTNGNIPKEKIFECVNVMRDVSVNAPVRIGDVVIDNVAETGVRLVATSNVDKTTN